MAEPIRPEGTDPEVTPAAGSREPQRDLTASAPAHRAEPATAPGTDEEATAAEQDDAGRDPSPGHAADDDPADATPTAVAPEPPTAEPVAAEPVAPVPVAPEPQPTIAPARDLPKPPRRRSNRLAGTAWVLLAAGLFEALYFLAVAALALLVLGAAAIGPTLSSLVQSRWGVFAWLPTLFFFLLFELTVMIAGRAGRFFYVVASGVVGLLVYALSVVLILVVTRGTMPDSNTLAAAFLNPTFILIGVVAREVMLWTGLAIGARGRRLRKRDRADRERYDRELAERSGT